MFVRVFLVALAAVFVLPAVVSGVTYSVSHQVGAGQMASAYQSMTAKTYPLGPFANKSSVLSAWDQGGTFASWWQYAVNPLPNSQGAQSVPFVFTFFGQQYTSLTVTSKGFVYLGEVDGMDALELDQYAPDFVTGAGLPSKPIISFLHSVGGAVAQQNLIGGGRAALTTPACQANQGPCVLQNYYYSVMPPITTFNSGGVMKQLTPVNSVGKTEDGFRFVLSGLQLKDLTGATASVVMVLYQSGLIEIFYYTLATTPANADTYGTSMPPPVTTPPMPPASNFGFASVGISDGQGHSYTLGQQTSQQSFAQLSSLLVNNLQGSAISFRPAA